MISSNISENVQYDNADNWGTPYHTTPYHTPPTHHCGSLPTALSTGPTLHHAHAHERCMAAVMESCGQGRRTRMGRHYFPQRTGTARSYTLSTPTVRPCQPCSPTSMRTHTATHTPTVGMVEVPTAAHATHLCAGCRNEHRHAVHLHSVAHLIRVAMCADEVHRIAPCGGVVHKLGQPATSF